MTVNFATLFTRLGKGIAFIEGENLSRGTTLPAFILAYQNQFDSASLLLKAAVLPGTVTADSSMRSGGSSPISSIQTTLSNAIIETVDADSPLSSKTITPALTELIQQMIGTGDDVDASTVGATASAITGNGDGVLVVSTKRADGRVNEYIYDEIITVECTSDTTPATATFTATGETAVTNKLSELWPAGSGASASITACGASSSLLGNGDFDDFDDVANVPDEWILSVGTIGTTIKSTAYEIQTLTVTGPPTAGTYRVSWSNAAGKVQTTAPIAYDATAATLQAAMRLLTGLESVTVTATGATPLYTHTITFVGVAGNVSQITITNNSTGGTYTPATTTAGSANAFVGLAVELDSDGAELTCLNRRVTLAALTQYAFNMWALADVVPAAGVLTVDLVDGIGGSVINDQAGTANSFTITGSALTTSFVAKNGVFRTPKILPPVVYLRIRISTAISAGTSVFIDHAALVAMTSLYTGGPVAAIFSGKTSFTKGGTEVDADVFTLTCTNNRAGEFQEWFERLFDMTSKGLILPSDTGGTETLDDSLIS